MERHHDDKQRAKLVARAWLDPTFNALLKASPEAALKEYDIEVPRGVKIVVVEDTEDVMHVTVPAARARSFAKRRR